MYKKITDSIEVLASSLVLAEMTRERALQIIEKASPEELIQALKGMKAMPGEKTALVKELLLALAVAIPTLAQEPAQAADLAKKIENIKTEFVSQEGKDIPAQGRMTILVDGKPKTLEAMNEHQKKMLAVISKTLASYKGQPPAEYNVIARALVSMYERGGN